MTVFKAYTNGFKEAVKLPRPVFLIWFTNLILAAALVIPLFGAMDEQIGNSAAADKLRFGFNATVWSDMWAEMKASVGMMFSQLKWLILIYWLLNIFFAGGIVRTLNHDKFTMQQFFAGSGYNFFRFLGISLIMLVIHTLILIAVWLPAGIIMVAGSESAPPETFYIRTILIAGIIHILLILFTFMLGDYAKFYAALYDIKNSFKAVRGSFSYVFSNFGKTFGLYLMLLILPFIVLALWLYADMRINTSISGGILIMFVIRQIFMLLRIWVRIWIFASPLQMFTEDFFNDTKVLKSLAVMQEWQKKALEQQKKQVADTEKKEPAKTRTLSEEEVLKQDDKIFINKSF